MQDKNKGTTSLKSGKSLIQLASDITSALGNLSEKEMRKQLCAVAKELEETGNQTVVLFFESGEMAIRKKDDKGTRVWRKAEMVQSESIDTICLIRAKKETVKLTEKVIRAAATAQKEPDKKGRWWVSIATCKGRIESILAKNGTDEIRKDYLPSIYKITEEGIKENIQSDRLCIEVQKRIEEEKKRLKKLFKLPINKPPNAATKAVVTHPSCKDEKVIQELQKLKDYVVTEKTYNEDNQKVFLEIVKRIAINGHPDIECIEMLQSISERKTGQKRSQYRIGVYLVNANIVCEFTRTEGCMKYVGWFPMTYDKSSQYYTNLVPIKHTERDTICTILHGAMYERLQPRIICFLKDHNGKKILNGSIYDLVEIRKDITQKIPIQSKYLILPIALALITNVNDLSISHVLKDQARKLKPKDGKNAPKMVPSQEPEITEHARTPVLPVQVMMDSDYYVSVQNWYRVPEDASEMRNDGCLTCEPSKQKSLEINELTNTENTGNDATIELLNTFVADSANVRACSDEETDKNEVLDVINEASHKKLKLQNKRVENHAGRDTQSTCLNTLDTQAKAVNFSVEEQYDNNTVELRNEDELQNVDLISEMQENQENVKSVSKNDASGEMIDAEGTVNVTEEVSDGTCVESCEQVQENEVAPTRLSLFSTDVPNPTVKNIFSTSAVPVRVCLKNAVFQTDNADGIHCEYEQMLQCHLEVDNNDVKITVNLDKSLLKGRDIKVFVNCNGDNVGQRQLDTKCDGVTVVGTERNAEKEVKKQKLQKKKSKSKKGKNKKTPMEQWLNVSFRQDGGNSRESEKSTTKVSNTRSESEGGFVKKIDIYGTGKGNVYTSPWEGLFVERSKVEAKGVRVLHKAEREKFIWEMGKVSPELQIRGFLALPKILYEFLGDRDEIKGMDKNEVEDPRYLAITQFYRGAWGKSIETLLEEKKEQAVMTVEEIETLFPRRPSDRHIDVECNLLSYKGTSMGTITGCELRSALGGLPRGKVPGISGLTYELLKEVGRLAKGKEMLKNVLTRILLMPDAVPEQLYVARLVGIKKPNGGKRPLCMQESLVKMLHKIITDRVMPYVAPSLATTQKCLTQSEGQLEARERVMEGLKVGKCVVQYDFVNAFGTILRSEIISRMQHYEVPMLYVKYIAEALAKQKIEWLDEDNNVKRMNIETGVPQGEPLSMLLFALGVDRLVQQFESMEGVHMTAYADDIVMVLENSEQVIQKIEEFEVEARKCGLVLNSKKTKVGIVGDLSNEAKQVLKEREVQVYDLEREYMEYVGLPITLSSDKEEEAIKKCVMGCVQKTKMLWEMKIPLQMKYHLQKLCIDSMILHMLKVAPMRSKEEMKWMEEAQEELDECWKTQIPNSETKYARLPVKYYGLGLLNLKDRRQVTREQWEEKEAVRRGERKKNGGKMRNVVEDYYKRKADKWISMGLIQNLDITKIPYVSNISLSQPPYSGFQRLSDTAFQLLLTLRYCSDSMDYLFGSLTTPPSTKCIGHPEVPMTIQHAVTCCKVGRSETIRRHNSLVSKVSGLLMRKYGYEHVHVESYSERQKAKKMMGKGKRADIKYLVKGVEHSVDVKVTSSWSQRDGNAVTRALGAKKLEYSGEPNVHIVLFDTVGNATAESIKYLGEIGARRDDLREMQKIVLEFTSDKVKVLAERGKNIDFKEAREKRRKEARNERRRKKKALNQVPLQEDVAHPQA